MTHIEKYHIFKEEIVLREGGREEHLCAYSPSWPTMIIRYDSSKRYSQERGQLELLAEDVARFSVYREETSPGAAERAEHPETAFAEIRCSFDPPYETRVASKGEIARTHTFMEREQWEFLGLLQKAYLKMRDPNKRHSIYIDTIHLPHPAEEGDEQVALERLEGEGGRGESYRPERPE